MNKENVNEYITAIEDTGFVLEYEVCRILEKNRWSIISNRYYLDDLQQVDREIDIIAYKAYEIDEVKYVTSLIISCKRSNHDAWTFLTKPLNKNDPNLELYPIANWTNNKIIEFMLKQEDLNKKMQETMINNSALKFIYDVPKQLFAFQKVNKKSKKKQDDKSIYDSIVTTIKALEFERNALNKRMGNDAFYNFNLLSIFEGEMIEIKFNDDQKTASEISEIKYLNRHIINSKEAFYKVHFINFKKFEEYVKHYDGLDNWNLEYYSDLITRYYEKINQCEIIAFNLLKDDFQKKIKWNIERAVGTITGEDPSISSIWFDKMDNDKKDNKLIIEIFFDDLENDYENVVNILNNNDTLKELIKETLVGIYHYKGDFEFGEASLPF